MTLDPTDRDAGKPLQVICHGVHRYTLGYNIYAEDKCMNAHVDSVVGLNLARD